MLNGIKPLTKSVYFFYIKSEFQMELKKVNLSLIIFLSYSARILYFGASYQDAPILLILAGVFGYLKFLEAKREILSENEFRVAVSNDIADLRTNMSTINLQATGNPFKQQSRRS